MNIPKYVWEQSFVFAINIAQFSPFEKFFWAKLSHCGYFRNRLLWLEVWQKSAT